MEKEEIRFIRNVIKAQKHLLDCCMYGKSPDPWAITYIRTFHGLYEDPSELLTEGVANCHKCKTYDVIASSLQERIKEINFDRATFTSAIGDLALKYAERIDELEKQEKLYKLSVETQFKEIQNLRTQIEQSVEVSERLKKPPGTKDGQFRTNATHKLWNDASEEDQEDEDTEISDKGCNGGR